MFVEYFNLVIFVRMYPCSESLLNLSFSPGAQPARPFLDFATISSFRACWMLKTEVKCTFWSARYGQLCSCHSGVWSKTAQFRVLQPPVLVVVLVLVLRKDCTSHFYVITKREKHCTKHFKRSGKVKSSQHFLKQRLKTQFRGLCSF